VATRHLQTVQENINIISKCKILIFISTVLTLLLISADNVKSSEEEDWLRMRRHAHDLFSICGINGEKMWAVGKLGTILHSGDGGKNWELQESTVEKSLFDVIFLDEKIGYIVGQLGLVLETKNGGEDWEIKQKDKEYHLFSISSTGDYLYAVGDFGTILRKRISAGADWGNVSLGEDIILNKIQFINNKTGWICGEFGLLLRTDSGGETWDKIESLLAIDSEGPFIFSLKFHNENIGVLTLPGNKVLLTEDGCQTWKSFVRKSTYYAASYLDGKWFFTGVGGVEVLDLESKGWEYPEFFEKSKAIGLWLRDGYVENGKGWFAGAGGSMFLVNDNMWEKVHP